ncbi:hypothetical protein [Riemerella columbina]|uniref:hypothetical protein n=1 Tax=Riemerella columbina TaxID=103810 RepID=UPI00035E22C8|nr:hypothetical protein [Riemerella columbina]
MINWTEEIKENLKSKTKNFSIQEKENINYQYLYNLLVKIENGTIKENEELKLKVECVVNEIPNKIEGKRISYNTKQLKDITNLEAFVEEKYNLFKKSKFKKRYMSKGTTLGMLLGLSIGVAIGKIGLGLLIGMPIGMAIGFLIGNYKDKKAEKENRIL